MWVNVTKRGKEWIGRVLKCGELLGLIKLGCVKFSRKAAIGICAKISDGPMMQLVQRNLKEGE